MSAKRPGSPGIKLDVYRETQSNLRRLGDVFPRKFIRNLAGDVLQNVSMRGRDLPGSIANPAPEQIIALSEALIAEDDTAGAAFIAGIQDHGVTPETVYLKYLAEAARTLGEWWETDHVTFATVTLGCSRIYAIMAAMRHLFAPRVKPQVKSAVFASVPGEEHVLGVRMAADMFRSEGWNIELKVGHDHEALIESIDWSTTALIGLSYGGVHSLQALTRLMLAVRINGPAVETLLCGHDIETVVEVAEIAGVSGCSDSVEDALIKMDALWDAAFIDAA